MNSDTIDLRDVTFRNDPYPTYARLQEQDAPFWSAQGGTVTDGMWMFTRYEDVSAILKDPRVSKDLSRILPPERLTPLEQSLLFKDPPDHTRLRGLTGQAFTPAHIRELEPRIVRIVETLLARAQQDGGMDFIADFALPLPVIVIAELLGVPQEDQDKFRAWSHLVVRGVDSMQASEEDLRRQEEAVMSLAAYFAALIGKRRQEPQNDVLSALISARDTQDKLTEDELLGTCILLLIAGHETTINLLGNGLYTLLRHPEQFARLKREPELMVSAIEEMLRFESPVQRATFRYTCAPFTVRGADFLPGQQVSAVLGAANRDPRQFPDPDRFDIARDPNRHLAFGFGIHFCLGAFLARMEARVGFSRLLAARPDIRLAPTVPQWQENTIFRGLKALPVGF